MKNYKVRVLYNFDDMEEKTELGTNVPRKVGDIFDCTKERYIYLKEHGAVDLVGIEKKQKNSLKVK